MKSRVYGEGREVTHGRQAVVVSSRDRVMMLSTPRCYVCRVARHGVRRNSRGGTSVNVQITSRRILSGRQRSQTATRHVGRVNRNTSLVGRC